MGLQQRVYRGKECGDLPVRIGASGTRRAGLAGLSSDFEKIAGAFSLLQSREASLKEEYNSLIRITQIRLACGHRPEALDEKIRKTLRLEPGVPVCRFSQTGSRAGKKQTVTYQIVQHSVDARKKPQLFDTYTVDVDTGLSSGKEAALIRRARNKNIFAAPEDIWRFPSGGTVPMTHRPVIIGAGPAGLFCALLLAEHGYRPLLIERGKRMEERAADVERFWEGGNHSGGNCPDANSNVQFGEGGAGTFSDGKLNTQINDRTGRAGHVLRTFAAAGAPESILYEGKPHIGTDRLRTAIPNLRRRIEKAGGEVRFRTVFEGFSFAESGNAGPARPSRKITGLYVRDLSSLSQEREFIPAETVILAIGHSARDTIEELFREQIPMEQKKFAVGLRVAHPQALIDESQYGTSDPAALTSMRLSAAPYKLTARAASGRGVYSFCMCPGGYVVNASSEAGHLCVNGMSDEARDSGWANSAIVVTTGEEEFGSKDVLAGLRFQRELERRAFEMGRGAIPIQRYEEFRESFRNGSPRELVLPEGGRNGNPWDFQKSESDRKENPQLLPKSEDAGPAGASTKGAPGEMVGFAAKGACRAAPLHKLLPEALTQDFIEGMEQFGKKIRGFNGPEAVVAGIESRTSSPVRIPRGESLEAVEVEGLYPCGEGAGYAGGIMSAAMDGMRVAEAVARRYTPGTG